MRARLRAKLAEVVKASGKRDEQAIAAKLGEREQAWQALTAPEAAELQKLLDPPLAAYVRPAEATLSATPVLADRWARGRPVWQRALAGAFVVQAYAGGLAIGWLLLGR